MNTETYVLLGVMTFLGLAFGWFIKGNNPFMIIIGLMLFGSVFEVLIAFDHYLFTAPFLFGVLIQIWQPIYERLRS